MALLALAPPSSSPAADPVFPWSEAPPVALQRGDLVCRRGNGLWSRHFAELSSRDPRFSHVGVVWETDPEPTIVHADASDWTGRGCVREGSWSDFFGGANSTACAVFRMEAGPETAARFAEAVRRRLGVPFDAAFDLGETNRLYCTELLAVALAETLGCDNLPRTTRKDKEYFAIDDLYWRGFRTVFDSAPLSRSPSEEHFSPP